MLKNFRLLNLKYSELCQSIGLRYPLFCTMKESRNRITSKPKIERTRPSQKILKAMNVKNESVLNKTIMTKPLKKTKKEKRIEKEDIETSNTSTNTNDKEEYLKSRKERYRNMTKKTGIMTGLVDKDEFLNAHEIQPIIYNAPNVEKILKVYNKHKFTFSTKNLTTSIHRLAKLLPLENKANKKENEHNKIKKKFKYTTQENRIQSLLYNIEQNLTYFNYDEKVIIYWSLTKMKFSTIELYDKLLKELTENLDKLRSKDISIIAWCLCKANKRIPKLYGMISLEIEKRISIWKTSMNKIPVVEAINNNNINTTQGLNSNLEKSKSEDEDINDKYTNDNIDDEDDIDLELNNTNTNAYNNDVKLNNDYFGCQSIALIMWCYTKSNIIDSDVFDNFTNIILDNIEYFTLLQLINILQSVYPLAKRYHKIVDNIVDRFDKISLDDAKTLDMKIAITLLKKVNFILDK